MLSSWLISFHPYYYFYLHGCKIAAVLPGLQLIQEKEKKRNTSKVYTIFLWKQESFQKLHSRSLFRSHNLEMCLMGIPCSKSIGQQMQSCCYVCSMHYLLNKCMRELHFRLKKIKLLPLRILDSQIMNPTEVFSLKIVTPDPFVALLMKSMVCAFHTRDMGLAM